MRTLLRSIAVLERIITFSLLFARESKGEELLNAWGE